MKKLPFYVLMLVFCCFLGGCNESGSQQKIGVVDINILMKDSVPGKEGLKYIETQQASLQGRLDAIQDKLEKNPNNEQILQELQKVYAESQQLIQSEGQVIVGSLFDAIQQTIGEFRKKNGYSLLLRAEALDSFDPALDVTQALMTDVNKLKIDFKAIASQAATQEAGNETAKQQDAGREQVKPETSSGPSDEKKDK